MKIRFLKRNSGLSVVRFSPMVLSIWPYRNIAHIQVLITFFFSTSPIKLILRLQIGERILIATHLDQSNYLATLFVLCRDGFVVVLLKVLGTGDCSLWLVRCLWGIRASQIFQTGRKMGTSGLLYPPHSII
jgi:hypothetical protein